MNGEPNAQDTLTIFCCSAPQDRDLVERFRKHALRPLEAQHVSITYSHDTIPGEDWERVRDERLREAHIILFFVSSDFVVHEQYTKLVEIAMERYSNGEVRIVPIILRPVLWKEDTPFGHLSPLPDNDKPVTDESWRDRNRAFVNIVSGLTRTIAAARANSLPGTGPGSRLPSPKPTSVRATYQPSREGNKGTVIFVLKGREHTLEYMRRDNISHQIFSLRERQQELVRLVVPFATLKTLERQENFQIDGVDCLFTFKMSAVMSIMSVKLFVGGEEVFRT